MVEQVNDFQGRFAVDTGPDLRRRRSPTARHWLGGDGRPTRACSTAPSSPAGSPPAPPRQRPSRRPAPRCGSPTAPTITCSTCHHRSGVVQPALERLHRAGQDARAGPGSGEVHRVRRRGLREPDEHLAAAPTYEDASILQWLLAQGAGAAGFLTPFPETIGDDAEEAIQMNTPAPRRSAIASCRPHSSPWWRACWSWHPPPSRPTHRPPRVPTSRRTRSRRPATR